MVDDRLLTFAPFTAREIRRLGRGLEWFVAEDYLTGELLGVSRQELQRYRTAADELYELFEAGAREVIARRRWRELGIPGNAIPIIEHSWEHRHQLPLFYGRFDLAGLIDGRPPKLIEFNADTATVLPETVDIQAAQLERAGLPPDRQFNRLFEQLQQQLHRLREKHPDKSPDLLVTTLGHEEDQLNADLIADAAHRSGFHTQVMQLPGVLFSAEDGVFVELNPEEFLPFDFCFKLVPWEFIALEEPELLEILTELVIRDKVVLLNPAYSMLFQSKGMLKILWELFPAHPLLLETHDSPAPFRGRPYVEKVLFGREGANIAIYDEHGRKVAANTGDFGHFPRIYQAFTELPQDSDGDRYQAGLYYAGEACALSFRRRDGLIVDDDAEFIGHYLID